jgi:hypothetical protein
MFFNRIYGVQVKIIGFFLMSMPTIISAQADSDSILQFYTLNDRYRIDKIEREHIPLHGDSVTMIPFRVDEKFGFVDKKSGKWLIKPLYEQVFAVYAEGAVVKHQNQYGSDGYGLVNREGKQLIPCQFTNLVREGNLYRGTIFGLLNRRLEKELNNTVMLHMYFDRSGTFLFSEEAHDFAPFPTNDSISWFRNGKEVHIRHRSGALIDSFNLDVNKTFIGICNNLLIYRLNKNGAYAYVGYDVQHNCVFELPLPDPSVNGIYQLSADLFGFYFDEGDYFFCDAAGNPKPYSLRSESVGFFRYDGSFFMMNHFAVKDENSELFGLINRIGDTILPFTYTYLSTIDTNLYLCPLGYINHLGKTVQVIPPEVRRETMELRSSIEHGLQLADTLFAVRTKLFASASADRYRNYYVHKSGELALRLPDAYVFAGDFSEGLAPVVNNNGKMGFIDLHGKLVIPLEFEISMAGSYPLPYLVVPAFQGGFAYIKAFKGYIDRKGKKYVQGKILKDHYNFSH